MFLTLLRAFIVPHLCHLCLFPPDFRIILGILFFYLHEDASELYPLIEILEYLFLNSAYLLALLNLSTWADLSFLPDERMP